MVVVRATGVNKRSGVGQDFFEDATAFSVDCCALAFLVLAEPFAEPTLAIVQVCWTSARRTSEMSSEVRSPRATRLT